jgi:hypothetical protein
MIDRLFSEMSKVLRDPAGDPRLTAIFVSIVLLLFLAFVIFVFVILPKAEDEEEDVWEGEATGDTPHDEEPSQSRSAGRFRGAFGLAITLGLIAVIVGGAAYADRAVQRDEFCPRCHVLEPAAASAAATPHRVARCIDCHRSPGLLGSLDLRLRMIDDLVANPTAEKIDKPAVVTEKGCRQCHKKELRDTLTVGVIRVRHSDFGKTVACAACHGRVGHSAEPTTPRPALRMAVCVKCHDGEHAPRECALCHLSDVAFTNEPATFGKIDLPAPTTCRGCHDLTGCTECHGVEMPHPENWSDPKVHAKLGAFDGSKTCDLCHESGCSPCHSQALHTNHGSDWKTVHATVKSSSGCLGCHSEAKVGPDMCKLCH